MKYVFEYVSKSLLFSSRYASQIKSQINHIVSNSLHYSINKNSSYYFTREQFEIVSICLVNQTSFSIALTFSILVKLNLESIILHQNHCIKTRVIYFTREHFENAFICLANQHSFSIVAIISI